MTRFTEEGMVIGSSDHRRGRLELDWPDRLSACRGSSRYTQPPKKEATFTTVRGSKGEDSETFLVCVGRTGRNMFRMLCTVYSSYIP